MSVCWELTEELRKRSRQFEFVLPAIDMVEEKNDLVVRIDLPGFTKDNINLRIVEDILTINAKREEEQQRHIGTQYYRQRPVNINRKVVLPFSTSDGEKVVGTAVYEYGVVTLRIPIPKSSYIPIT